MSASLKFAREYLCDRMRNGSSKRERACAAECLSAFDGISDASAEALDWLNERASNGRDFIRKQRALTAWNHIQEQQPLDERETIEMAPWFPVEVKAS